MAATPAFTEAVTASIDDEGLHIAAVTYDAHFRWSGYDSVVDVPEGLGLVMKGANNLRWLPARAFSSDEHRRSWHALASRGIAGAAGTTA